MGNEIVPSKTLKQYDRPVFFFFFFLPLLLQMLNSAMYVFIERKAWKKKQTLFLKNGVNILVKYITHQMTFNETIRPFPNQGQITNRVH